MQDVVFKRQALVLITWGVLTLFVVSVIIESFVFYPVHASPNPPVATETSGCTTPLTPRENKLYMLSSQMNLSGNNTHTSSTQTNPPLSISAIDTNGRQSWTQPFTNLSPDQAFLKTINSIIYAAAGSSGINTVAAYNANNGKKLWNIQLPADAQSQSNNTIAGMLICNNMVYIWKLGAIYAYNAKNGSLLWQNKGLPSHAITFVEVTDTAVAFVDTNEIVDNSEGTIHALDAKKGTQLWTVNIPRNEHSFGLALTATDKAIYVSQFNQDAPLVVEAFSISNGRLLWNTPVSLKSGNHLNCLDSCHIQPIFTLTLVANNTFYLLPGLGSGADGIVALNVNHGTLLWKDSTVSDFYPLQDKLYVSHTHAPDVCQVDPITGKSQWCYVSKFPENSPVRGMISDQATVYIPMLDGVHALQKSNGAQKWIYKGSTSGTASMMLIYGLSFDY